MIAGGEDPAVAAAAALGLQPGDRLGVATSGGPDSLAALVIAARVFVPLGVPTIALHVDHGIRQDRAEAEADLVAKVAASVGAGFAMMKVDVPAARARDGGSIEFVARTLRMEALDALAVAHDLTHVLLAHHLDDQIETVLLALVRGAFPGALAGMPESRELPSRRLIVRPFLAVPRAVLRAHAAGLGAVDDPMNADPAHRRVVIRDRLLPALRACDAHASDAVTRVAAAARVIDRACENEAWAIRAEPEFVFEHGVITAPLDRIRGAGRFALARLLKDAFLWEPALGHVTWHLVDMIEREAAAPRDAILEIRRGVLLSIRDGTLAIFTPRPPGWTGASATWDGAPLDLPAGGTRSIEIVPIPPEPLAAEELMIRVALRPGARIEIRPRRAGDRFPLGSHGSKRVADELCDRKIHPAMRGRVPLVFVDGVLRWMPNVRVVTPEDESAPNAAMMIRGRVLW